MKKLLLALLLAAVPSAAFAQFNAPPSIPSAPPRNGCTYFSSPATLTNGQAQLPLCDTLGARLDDLWSVAGTALGAPANYGTSPGAVKVPGVNAYVTSFGTGSAGTPSGGVATIQGSTATGSALASYPVLIGGSDGTDVRNISTDSSGHVTIIGTGTLAVQATLQASATTAIGKVDPNTIATWGLAAIGGAASPTNALTVAGVYNTTLPTISNTDVAGIQIDGFGRIVLAPFTVTSNTLVKGTTSAMTGTSSTQVIAAVSSQRIYVTSIHCNNSSSTATLVSIQDGSSGTTLDTLICPAGGGDERNNGYTPMFWTTAGNGLYAADVTTSASVIVSASGYSSAN